MEEIKRIRIRFRRERRACYLPCLRLGFGDDRRGASIHRDVNLTIFITSISLASFFYLSFHFRKLASLRLAFDAAKRNIRFGHIRCHRSKESSSRGKRRVFFCRRTMRVGVKGIIISSSFLKIEGRGSFIGAEEGRKRDS